MGEPASPFSPSRAIVGLVGETMAGHPKSIKDLASFSSGSSGGNVHDSDMDTTSGDCISCSDTDEVSGWTANKKYRKRVWASCRLKNNPWMETQQKRINNSHQDVWGNDCKIIKTEQKCAFAEDHISFEMLKNGKK